MKPLSLGQKFLSFLAACLTFGFTIIQIKFLLTEKYTADFIDFFSRTTIWIVSTLIVLLTILLIQKTVAIRLLKIVLFFVLPLTTIILTLVIREKLDTTNLSEYRKDLGLQAYYLYLNESENRFILYYTYPFGKTTIIGNYIEKDSIIHFDKDLKSCFNLQNGQTGFKTSTLDIRDLTKL